MDIPRGRAPWHLWLVGILTLLFNGYGAFDYYMTQTGDAAYMQMAGESMGVDGPTALAFFGSFPPWMVAFWAIGVFSSVAGSLLLLARSRLTVAAFVLALVGLVGTAIGQLSIETPDWASSQTTTIIAIVIWSVQVFSLIYFRSMRLRGVLR